MKNAKEMKKEIIELIAAIEKDDGEGVVIEIETLMDNVLPCEYTPDEMRIFENAVHGLQHDGEIRIIDNCSVQKIRR